MNKTSELHLDVRSDLGTLSRDQRQQAVADWCAAAFGAEHQASVPQRGLRMLEEAIETYQAIDGNPATAHKLVDYIFAKEPGKIGQELGGLGVTVLALAAAAGLSADKAETQEINRVLSKPLEWFHARNKVKNDAGFDATAYPVATPDTEPQPEVAAEPVAWRCEDLILKGVVSIIDDREHAEMRRETGAWKITPLYTTPPVVEEAVKAESKPGIYVASKIAHADLWRDLRHFERMPIISTWIDEPGADENQDLTDLWRRCVSEASSAGALILYRRPNEVLKGAWVELGAALASGVPVFAVGIEEFTIAKHAGITHCRDLIEARRLALSALSSGDAS